MAWYWSRDRPSGEAKLNLKKGNACKSKGLTRAQGLWDWLVWSSEDFGALSAQPLDILFEKENRQHVVVLRTCSEECLGWTPTMLWISRKDWRIEDRNRVLRLVWGRLAARWCKKERASYLLSSGRVAWCLHEVSWSVFNVLLLLSWQISLVLLFHLFSILVIVFFNIRTKHVLGNFSLALVLHLGWEHFVKILGKKVLSDWDEKLLNFRSCRDNTVWNSDMNVHSCPFHFFLLSFEFIGQSSLHNGISYIISHVVVWEWNKRGTL